MIGERMGLIELFKKSFNVLRDNPKIILPVLLLALLFGGVSVMWATHILRGLPTQPSLLTSGLYQSFGSLFVVFLFLFVVMLFVNPIIKGFYISSLDQGYKRRKVSLKSALDATTRNYLRLLLTEVLLDLIWFVAIAIIGLVFFAPVVFHGLGLATGLLLLLGILVFVVVYILLSIYLYQAYVVVMYEGSKAVDAVKKSIEIGRRHFFDIFAVLVLTAIFLMVFVAFDVAIVGGVEFLVALGSRAAAVVVGSVLSIILASFFDAWIYMIPAAFYKGYIDRKKGGRKAAKRMRRVS